MIVGIVVGGTCLICLAVVSTVCYMRKKAKIGQISSEELHQIETDSQQWVGGQTNEKVMLQENYSVHQLNSMEKKPVE